MLQHLAVIVLAMYVYHVTTYIFVLQVDFTYEIAWC